MTRVSSVAILALAALTVGAAAPHWQDPQPPPPAQQPPTQQPPPAAPQVAPVVPQVILPPPRPVETIVIDPGHGGQDAGARGSSGIIEKDYTMFLALRLRDELQRQGLRTAITRELDQNPSFDERAALANAFARPIFVTLHAGSTGQPGSARVYHSRPLPSPAAAEVEGQKPSPLTPWDSAQNRYLDDSRRLAQLVQAQLAAAFDASPKEPAPAALRQLKSITGPAIAVEISSVAVRERSTLDQMAGGVVAAIARGVAAFRSGAAQPTPQPGASQ